MSKDDVVDLSDEETELHIEDRGGHQATELDDLLSERLEEAFHKQTSKVRLHEIAKIAEEYAPVDLAYSASRLPPAVRPVLYENLPDLAARITFLINTDSNTRSVIFRHVNDQEIKKVIEGMPPDEAVWVLDDLSDRRYRKVLELLDVKKANKIRELQKHDRNSAGRLMTNEFFAFTMDVTIGEVATSIRDNPGIDFTRRIFVLNHAGELQGYVPVRNLIVNPPHLPLRQVMRSILHKVTPEATRDEVIDLVERYKISALPVVDVDNFLVGVVTYEDVVEAMEDVADETLARVAGTAEDVGANDPIFKRFISRAPWLLVTLCGGLTNAASISYFESKIGAILGFAIFFVPLITGMSGNVGIQCSTVLVRGMAVGIWSKRGKREAASREIMIGLVSSVCFGALAGIAAYALHMLGLHESQANPLAVTMIVSAGVFTACMVATFLGSYSPLFFSRIGIDPAVASGPMVTAFNDVLSMIFYFLVASFISQFIHL